MSANQRRGIVTFGRDTSAREVRVREVGTCAHGVAGVGSEASVTPSAVEPALTECRYHQYRRRSIPAHSAQISGRLDRQDTTFSPDACVPKERFNAVSEEIPS